jgi:hypothetical protein
MRVVRGVPRYTVVKWTVRQHNREGYGVARITPDGKVQRMPQCWAKLDRAEIVADILNGQAEGET